jgi:hypothetical protein
LLRIVAFRILVSFTSRRPHTSGFEKFRIGVLKVVPKNECVGHEYISPKVRCLEVICRVFENTESRGTKIEKPLNDNVICNNVYFKSLSYTNVLFKLEMNKIF